VGWTKIDSKHGFKLLSPTQGGKLNDGKIEENMQGNFPISTEVKSACPEHPWFPIVAVTATPSFQPANI
jgi:hypothetical protein